MREKSENANFWLRKVFRKTFIIVVIIKHNYFADFTNHVLILEHSPHNKQILTADAFIFLFANPEDFYIFFIVLAINFKNKDDQMS